MKLPIAILPLVLIGTAHAQMNCMGAGAMQTCFDARSGNAYNIQRMGNTTTVQGTNSRNGTRWNETTQTFGNTTYMNGTAANGQRWNSTIMSSPGMEHEYGTDSNGQPFSRTCTAAGCF